MWATFVYFFYWLDLTKSTFFSPCFFLLGRVIWRIWVRGKDCWRQFLKKQSLCATSLSDCDILFSASMSEWVTLCLGFRMHVIIFTGTQRWCRETCKPCACSRYTNKDILCKLNQNNVQRGPVGTVRWEKLSISSRAWTGKCPGSVWPHQGQSEKWS